MVDAWDTLSNKFTSSLEKSSTPTLKSLKTEQVTLAREIRIVPVILQ